MAGGMHAAVAASGIVPYARHLDMQEVIVSMDKGDSVEITALSEELSQEAAEILQERHLLSRPLKSFGRSCAQQISLGTGEEDDAGKGEVQKRRSQKKVDTMNPLLRLALGMTPILTWFPRLRPNIIKADFIAGLTVGVMVIPQSMSYASIAGLPYIYGMYSACVPTLVYAVFGQSRQLAVGPVAMVSLLVEAGLRGVLTQDECPAWYEMGGEASGKAQYEVCPDAYVGLATLTAAVVGVMQIVAAFLKLGFLVSFLGHPVTSGFTSGAAIIIGLSQLKYILGYEIKKSQYIYETLAYIVMDIDKTQGMSVLLGVVFFLYLIMNKSLARNYKRLKWLGPLGPLISCAAGTLLVMGLPVLYEVFHVKYVGTVPEGLMPMSFSTWRLNQIPRVLPTALSSCLIGYM